jgi:hypothetical protein
VQPFSIVGRRVVLQRTGWRIGLHLWPWLADRRHCGSGLLQRVPNALRTRRIVHSLGCGQLLILNVQVLKTAAVVWRTPPIAERISPPFRLCRAGCLAGGAKSS